MEGRVTGLYCGGGGLDYIVVEGRVTGLYCGGRRGWLDYSDGGEGDWIILWWTGGVTGLYCGGGGGWLDYI